MCFSFVRARGRRPPCRLLSLLLALSALSALCAPTMAEGSGRSVTASVTVLTGDTAQKTINLEDYAAPYFPNPQYGLDYSVRAVPPGFFSRDPYIVYEGYLRYALSGGVSQGETAAVEVDVGCYGREPLLIVLTFTARDHHVLAVSGVSVPDKTYDGAPAAPEGSPVFTRENGDEARAETVVYAYTGTRADGSPYPETAQPPADAGTYALTVTGEDIGNRSRGDSGPIPFEIGRRTLTIRPLDVEIPSASALPDVFEFAYEGFAHGEGPEALDELPRAELGPLVDGAAEILIVNAPCARNYETVLEAGVLTVAGENAGTALDGTYITADPPNADGWHNRDIVVRPAGKDGFTEISLSRDGPFGESAVIGAESANGTAPLYLRGGARTAVLEFVYRLDKTPPTAELVFSAPPGLYGGRLSLLASDALSGVDFAALTDPAGAPLSGSGGVYAAVSEGEYTAAVADRAGNRIVVTQSVSLGAPAVEWEPERAQPAGIAYTAGTVRPSGGSGRTRSGASSSTREEDGPTGEELYWERVIRSLREAGDGEGVSITPDRYRSVPAGVLLAIRGRDVTLRINRGEAGKILLHGMALPALDGAKAFYSLDDLAAMAYAPAGAEAPEAAGPEPLPARMLPAGTGETQTAAEPESPPPGRTAVQTAATARQNAPEIAPPAPVRPAGAAAAKPGRTAGMVTAALLAASALGTAGFALLHVLRGGPSGAKAKQPEEEPAS